MTLKWLRNGSFLVLALLLCGAPIAAQTDPILFVGWPAGAFYLFTPTTGAITPVAPGPAGFWGAPRIKILPGNRMVLGRGLFTARNSFFLFDRDSGTSFPFSMPLPPTQESVYEFTMDQDGDLFVTLSHSQGIWRMDHLQPGNYVRLFPTGDSELVQDIDTGDYVFLNYPTFNLVRGRRSGQVTPISLANLGPGQRLYQDYATGEFIYWPNWWRNVPQTMYRISGSGVVTSITTVPWVFYEMMEIFSAPAPGREYFVPIFGDYAPVRGFHALDRSNGQVTLLLSFPPWLQGVSALVRDRSRKLSTIGTGFQNQWNLFVDFADDPNRLYVCLVGITGIRPGIPLPDGRVIRLNVDPVTWLGLSGQIPGFSGLVGRLDARGAAQGLLDLGWLPPGVTGIPFWLAGFTLDPTAPSGIRTVSDPIVIQLR
jgi:hypothetical protein